MKKTHTEKQGQYLAFIKSETWRRIIKPRYAQMFKRTHDYGMDVW